MKFNNTNISDRVFALLENVIKTTRLSEGDPVRQFEIQLQRALYLPRKPAALNSGTSGLHLALVVAGVQAGDEVIIPPQTFIATGLAVLMQQAKPVFVDIRPTTGNICPKAIKKSITPKTKAILVVHWGGYPCDMDEINAIAKEHHLKVIEDAAHAIGATYKNRPIGSISDFTVFSFQAIKHLTTGDGGAVCSLTEQDERELLKRRWFDIDREHATESVLGEREYDAEHVGYKYHMNNIAAALGLGNLPELSSTLKKHRMIRDFYREHLKSIQGITLLENALDRESSCWFFPMLVEDRLKLIQALKAQGVPASVVNQRIDKNKVFGGITAGLLGQEKFDEKHLALPIHAALTDDDLQLVVDSVKKGW